MAVPFGPGRRSQKCPKSGAQPDRDRRRGAAGLLGRTSFDDEQVAVLRLFPLRRASDVETEASALTAHAGADPNGLALEDRGKFAVLEKIGVEPTGDAFNEISLSPDTGRPFNPMINAGAITATSLVAGRSMSDRCHDRL